MGGLLPRADQRRIAEMARAGDLAGPRIVLAGGWVDGSPGSRPGMDLADTPNRARKNVERIAREGWAAVKSHSMPRPETYLALAVSARDAEILLVGRIP